MAHREDAQPTPGPKTLGRVADRTQDAFMGPDENRPSNTGRQSPRTPNAGHAHVVSKATHPRTDARAAPADSNGDSYWEEIESNDPQAAAAYLTNVVEGCVEELNEVLKEAEQEIPKACRQTKRWTLTHYALGIPAAVLAAMAAATGLASTAGRIPAAIIALTAAGVSAVAAFLNGTKRAQEYARSTADWESLRDLVSVCLATDVPAVKAWKKAQWAGWLKYRVDLYIAAMAALRHGEPLSSVKDVFGYGTSPGGDQH
jgi:hypothetical protein